MSETAEPWYPIPPDEPYDWQPGDEDECADCGHLYNAHEEGGACWATVGETVVRQACPCEKFVPLTTNG